ncbi:manganese efflux pump MntP [Ornithinibacillus gellani]|uniref:manganese efflux pump MntP n=1 Tax=Ornithinibacillus gellani TaxID=2293253 RepID=UPI001CC1D274|nr:manganese efflux pump [Ornithinibacillus gellani]
MSETMLGELSSLLLMAIALGMDAFSVGLGLGMKLLRLKRIAIIGLTIGLFHVWMPFTGIMLGKVLSIQAGAAAQLFGGLLVTGIGAHMLFSAFNHEQKRDWQPIGLGLMLLSFSVSLDSFSAGIGLGLSGVKTAFVLLLFGITSMLLTWSGLLLGRKTRHVLGAYSEILGGSMLMALGMYFILG